MKVTKFPVQGPMLIELRKFDDARGFFVERYKAPAFAEIGITAPFAQDNFSRSNAGVLRGLHYQFAPAQAKLVTCLVGHIFDVIVDIRKDSPTYGQHLSVELRGDKPACMWVPAGFAHGFCVLGNEPADVLYKTDTVWAPNGEGGIAWNDPDLNISWPVRPTLVSDKDAALPSFKSYSQAPKF